MLNHYYFNNSRITKEDFRLLLVAVIISFFAFFGFYIAYAATDSSSPTLTASVTTSLSFTVSTVVFGNIEGGGSAKFATSTLDVVTNNSTGWRVALAGDNQGEDADSTTMYIVGDYTTTIPDQTEWVHNPSATSTGGNAVQIGSLSPDENVLAFRVMTASGTMAFRASGWWGTEDNYTDSANTKWAGIASSTAQRNIGNTNVPSGGTALNTVLYYLKASGSQTLGNYTGDLTYTATTN